MFKYTHSIIQPLPWCKRLRLCLQIRKLVQVLNLCLVFLLTSITFVHAQNDWSTIDSIKGHENQFGDYFSMTEEEKAAAKKEVFKVLYEMFDVALARDMMQIRQISNVRPLVNFNVNGELQDSIEYFRTMSDIDVFVRSMMMYDHIWARVLNRDNYQGLRGAENENPDTAHLKFDIKFHPLWDTTISIKERDAQGIELSYWVEIRPETGGLIDGEINISDLDQIIAAQLAGKNYTDIKNNAKPEINEAIFIALDYIIKSSEYEGTLADHFTNLVLKILNDSLAYNTELLDSLSLTFKNDSICLVDTILPQSGFISDHIAGINSRNINKEISKGIELISESSIQPTIQNKLQSLYQISSEIKPILQRIEILEKLKEEGNLQEIAERF